MSDEVKAENPAMSLLGRQIGNVRLTARIGKGGVGVVYKAEHEVLGTPYAVKVLHRKYSQNETITERFRREAIASGRLHHPNVVFVTDFGFKEGIGIYIIMEYLEGDSLEVLLAREGRLEVARAGRIALQICDALEAAHRLDIIHRDLKPANIHVRPVVGRVDMVKVLDFGIARLTGEAGLTQPGRVVGSPHYMAPEQVQGFSDQVGPETDIYALGVLIYQMIAGVWPIWDLDMFKLCMKHITEIPASIGVHRPELKGSALEALLAAMLAKKVGDRPRSLAEVAGALDAALAALGPRIEGPLASADDADDAALATSTDLLEGGQIRMFHLVQALRVDAQRSPVVALLNGNTALMNLPGEVFRTLIWGVLVTELLDAPVESGRLTIAAQQAAALLDSALHEDAAALDHALVRSVGALLNRLDTIRQGVLIRALQPLSANPLFPVGMLPTWATVQTTGTWKLSKVDAHLENVLDDKAASVVVSNSAELGKVKEETAESRSLLVKLSRPVSIESVKNVLTHRIGGRKEGD